MKFFLQLVHAFIGYLLSFGRNTIFYEKQYLDPRPNSIPNPNRGISPPLVPTNNIRVEVTPDPAISIPISSPIPDLVPIPAPAPVSVPVAVPFPFPIPIPATPLSDLPAVKFTPISVDQDDTNTRDKNKACELKCTIPLTLDFVCGTNSVTYYNFDELRCARRRCFPDLKLAHVGKCREKFDSDSNFNDKENKVAVEVATGHDYTEPKQDKFPASEDEQIKAENIGSVIANDDSIIFRPNEDNQRVHSYDNIEIDIKSLDHDYDYAELGQRMRSGFDSRPSFNFIRTKPNFDEIKHAENIERNRIPVGSGSNSGKKNLLVAQVGPTADCGVDQCSCSYTFHQVCGTDGRTYENDCILKCKQACDPDLRKYHNGKCRFGGEWLGLTFPQT